MGGLKNGMAMRFEWDKNKNRANKAKHGISFETAVLVFDDPYHVSIQDRHEQHEERWQTIGLLGGSLVLLVAHTFFEGDGEAVVRIISARKATSRERQFYEENH